MESNYYIFVQLLIFLRLIIKVVVLRWNLLMVLLLVLDLKRRVRQHFLNAAHVRRSDDDDDDTFNDYVVVSIVFSDTSNILYLCIFEFVDAVELSSGIESSFPLESARAGDKLTDHHLSR